MEHDFDPHTDSCRNCGIPRYGVVEFPQLAECSNSRNVEEAPETVKAGDNGCGTT